MEGRSGFSDIATSASALLQLIDSIRGNISVADKSKYICGKCPDPACKATLYFPSYERSVLCSKCYQRHDRSNLSDIKEVSEMEEGERQRLLSTMYYNQSALEVPKKAEMMKVQGISHYQCKLLSHLLTTYGMDKSGSPKLLRDLGGSESFDCSKLSRYAFAIDEMHLDQAGYGIDTGSHNYLADTLSMIDNVNEGETLVPLHADGDGHCLVHAVSRCLIGRELFWHSLRSQLQQHLRENLQQYKAHFKEFIEDDEWEEIIDEAGPDYIPPDDRGMGLRNIHIFGLANVLHRPIVLLDSLDGMSSCADYSGVFLPAFVPPASCQYEENGQMCYNQPIVIGWSSAGRNHFVPLVQIKGRQHIKLPKNLCPKVWGVDPAALLSYTEGGDLIKVASGKAMTDAYLKRLLKAMEDVFYDKYKVRPSLVADVEHDVYRRAGYVSMKPMEIASVTKDALQQDRLRRCLFCKAVCTVVIGQYEKGGHLYELAAEEFALVHGNEYYFPVYKVRARYDGDADKLIPTLVSCLICDASGSIRKMYEDGSIVYENGDRTDTESPHSKCRCGFKHFWDGKEYDNLPRKLRLPLSWNNQSVEAEVYWFEGESDPSLNSNAYNIASHVVEKYFPGEFGSERLVQSAVDAIIKGTAKTSAADTTGSCNVDEMESNQTSRASTQGDMHKLIATGPKAKTLHKEELGLSQTEIRIKQRVQDHATLSSSNSKGRPSMSKASNILQQASSKQPSKSTEEIKKVDHSSGQMLKRLRIITSDGNSKTVTLSLEATFSDLQSTVEKELNVPCSEQILKSGIPPKIMIPSRDPNAPVDLKNGDRVAVERHIKGSIGSGREQAVTNTQKVENSSTGKLLCLGTPIVIVLNFCKVYILRSLWVSRNCEVLAAKVYCS
jgi:deubiquitinating protein VCIP135